MSNVSPFKSSKPPRYTAHYKLMTPRDAVGKYGITYAWALSIFKEYGIQSKPGGNTYMHPDTLEAYLREPWKYEKKR